MKRDPGGAIADCERALALDARCLRAIETRAYNLFRIGRHRQAAEGYARAIELAPTKARNWANRAVNRSELGDHEGALQDFDEAARLGEATEFLLMERGRTLQALGRWARARDDFLRLVKIKPDDVNYLMRLGLARFQLGEHEGAVRAYDRVLRVQPRHALAWANRAANLAELDRLEEALRSAERGVELGPSRESYLTLARIQELRAEWAAARASFREVLRFRPNDPDANEALKRLQGLADER